MAKVLSCVGDSLICDPFVTVEQDGTLFKLTVCYIRYGQKQRVEVELNYVAMQAVAVAIIQAMRLPEDSR